MLSKCRSSAFTEAKSDQAAPHRTGLILFRSTPHFARRSSFAQSAFPTMTREVASSSLGPRISE
jgi:hypothetical protein